MNVQSVDDIFVRQATNADGERIRALVFGVLAEYGLQPEIDDTDADLNNIEGNYIERGGNFEIVEDGEGKLLGTIGLYPLDDKTCELRKMYFVKEVRGIGLGKDVLARTVERARELGFEKIVLETASVLEQAIKLYTRFGFVPTQKDHVAARCDQVFMLDLSK